MKNKKLFIVALILLLFSFYLSGCKNIFGIESVDGQTDYYAVIVGVADYQNYDADTGDLNYTDDDAQEMYNTLVTYGNWDATHIQLLTNSGATKADIESAIETMGVNADGDDFCLFFFSGHGGYYSDLSPLDESDGYDEYICPYDTGDSTSTVVWDDELYDWLSSLPTSKVCVILDSCFSGGMAKGISGRTVKFLSIKEQVSAKGFKSSGSMSKALSEGGYLVLMASDEDESSWEASDLENGVFSYYMIEGLTSYADANGDNILTSEEVFSYASPKVKSYTSGVQNPQMLDYYFGKLAMAY